MAEPLSDYEKYRLDNIARNQSVLEQLGLVEAKIPTAPVIKKRKQPDEDVAAVQHVRRVMPKRGEGRKSYNYAEEYNLLDELEKEENDRIKVERKANRRETRPVKRYDDSDFNSGAVKNRKRQPSISTVEYSNAVFPGDFTIRPLQTTHSFNFCVDDDDKNIDKQHAKWFRFKFTPSHLKDATYSDKAVKAFQLFCDERAHVRFSSLTQIHSEKDIIDVAKTISAKSDTSSFDASLVKDYRDAVQCFEFNTDKLAPPTSYRSDNPKVYCPGCGNIFAYTADGTIRAHVCR